MNEHSTRTDRVVQATETSVNNKVFFVVLAVLGLGALALVWQRCFSGAAIAVSKAQDRMDCGKNIKMIVSALRNYQEDYGVFPPAFTTDESGTRLHSWRTLILPYLEESDLYSMVDLSQPWNAAINQSARETVVDSYHCPSDPRAGAYTRYFAVLIDDGIMKEMGPTNPNTISDGLDKTIAFVESRMEASIPWMEPVDLSVSEFLAYNFQTQMSDHTGGTHVATADGSIFFITNSIDKETLAGLLTGSGGESVDFYW